MLKRGRSRVVVVCVVVLLAAMTWSATGSELRTGGRTVVVGSALPSVAGSAEVDLFAGLGSLEASSTTELSLFPYTMGNETIAVSLVRDWLSLTAEYQFSLAPLGITAPTILMQATPPAWVATWGLFLVDAGVDAEARLLGDGLAATPLRAEVWVRGGAGIGCTVSVIDYLRVAATLEATLSAPNGTIWPTPSLLASASVGRVTLSSETELAFAGGIHVAAEAVSLVCSWLELGISARAWCTFSGEPTGPSVGLRIAYEFGAHPLRPFPDSAECVGGVCH